MPPVNTTFEGTTFNLTKGATKTVSLSGLPSYIVALYWNYNDNSVIQSAGAVEVYNVAKGEYTLWLGGMYASAPNYHYEATPATGFITSVTASQLKIKNQSSSANRKYVIFTFY